MAMLFFAALVALPFIEIAAFVEIGKRIGTLPTILALIASTFAGLMLIRWQGTAIFRRATGQMMRGTPPLDAGADGMGLSLAGLLFIIPGFVTDVLALALLIPPVRRRLLNGARFTMMRGGPPGRTPPPRRSEPVQDAIILPPEGTGPPREGSPWRRPGR